MAEIIETFRRVSDAAWFEVLCRAADEPVQAGVRLPGLPPVNLQINSVGEHGAAALREGLRFYQEVKRCASVLGRPIDPERVVLDFGCGWGRMTRFFLKDVRPENLHGADVSPSLVALCRESIPSCPFWLIDPMPPSTFDRDTFDVIYAYSVFSHLSERAHLRWIEEFARILKPGGVLLVTTRGRDFIALCHSLRGRTGGDPYRELLASAFPDPRAANAAYDAGSFIYVAYPPELASYGPDYGEALVPRSYVERAWSPWLTLRDFVDDRARLQQAMFVMQKA